MSDDGVGADLRELIQARQTAGLQPLVDTLNGSTLPAAVTRFNSEFGVRYFGRPPGESIPTHPSELTSFRARLGGLIEYGLGVVLDAFLRDDYGDDLRLSFAVATEYPDFYMRDAEGVQLLRIDSKILHDESAEFSARFRLPASEIRALDDLLLYVAWRWTTETRAGAELVYPEVLDGLFVPAAEIAHERDERTLLTGGKIESGTPLVPSRSGGWSEDTNYGKIDRIVHESRRDAEDLSSNVRAFLSFTQRHAAAVERAEAGVAETSPTPDEVSPT